ncbi:polysaccharide pyruvyl transferase family protein [Dactylosporangium fulvum]|uniref:Polysaccharide pyruvyl transferase family protein n=1 Tax=Dactylosporangium fulvum TaxID=53359 RepID=A0ABY5VV28_9ACTN|nr:polysaccharide pyruvyl transferase family protein [Dactylosporangium fulvum]UWP80914.1 polysaccharide pyruvyl transferase family protein [Dactylosporangium fulvum]
MTEHGPRVGVLGSYGGYNLGDEAILTSLLTDLRARRPDTDVLVLSRDPEHTARAHPDVTVAPWEGVSRDRTAEALARLDLLVLGGGGILYDTEARRYLRVVRTAQEQRVPVFTYALGAGPLTEDLDCTLTRETLSAAMEVTVRDEESKVALEEAGVTSRVTVTADPALLLQPEEFNVGLLHDSLPPGRRVVGMSVREPGRAAQHLAADEYHQLLAHVGDFIVHRLDAALLFVPMERSDIRHAHAVLSRMTAAEHCRVLHGEFRPGQILDLMRHLDLAVGMRLHFLIFAALSGVPLLALPYAGKVFDFAQRIGAPVPRGVVREAAGPLLAQVDRLWDERPERMEDIAARVAALRQRATETGRRLGAQLDRIAPQLSTFNGHKTTPAPERVAM